MQPSIAQSAGIAFDENRARLWRVAYRMLGSRADADDIVQDAYLRWHGSAHDDIRAPQAWLMTTTTRLAIDRLRQRRTERESYTGPWLPEPLVEPAAPPADQCAEIASDLSVAFLAVMERLAPEERAAFLLHEVFDSGYEDIARILDKSEEACRQIVSRAAKRVRADRPRMKVNAAVTRRLLNQLASAVQSNDQTAMLEILAADSKWTSDGGGKARAARKVIQGALKLARFGTGVFRKYRAELTFRPILVNEEPGLAALWREHLVSIIAIRTDGEKIVDVYSILNPDKLRDVRIG
jgi:RNA polymerase sigma-70 factor (ECF subfamily)